MGYVSASSPSTISFSLIINCIHTYKYEYISNYNLVNLLSVLIWIWFRTEQLILVSPIMGCSCPEITNSSLSVVTRCLWLFIYKQDLLRFNPPIFFSQLLLSLFRSCVGNHIVDILCVQLSDQILKTQYPSRYPDPLTEDSSYTLFLEL